MKVFGRMDEAVNSATPSQFIVFAESIATGTGMYFVIDALTEMAGRDCVVMQSPKKEHIWPIARESAAKDQKFVAVDRSVMRGREHIATAVSANFARRIARALNLHKPNSRGV
jgi:hypothetical protein